MADLLVTFFSSSDLQPRAGSKAERAQLQYGHSRTFWSSKNQEEKGGARGGAQGSSAAGSCGSGNDSRTCPGAGIGQTRTGAAPRSGGPRSALEGQGLPWEG